MATGSTYLIILMSENEIEGNIRKEEMNRCGLKKTSQVTTLTIAGNVA